MNPDDVADPNADMMSSGTYSGWNFDETGGTWVMDEGGSYAHFKYRYENGVRGISGKVLNESGIEPLAPKDRVKVIIAYEPLWAIGKTASAAISSNDLAEMVLYIRKVLAELLPGKNSAHSSVLYGGSVESSNMRALAGASGVDGFLIGHASVDPREFSAMVRQLD